MKRATLVALAVAALATPYFANAQDDAAKTAAAIATTKAKLQTVVDASGKVAPNPCVVTNAADYGQIQEAVCEGGLGYMIFPGATGLRAVECASVNQTADDQGLIAACRLTENRNPLAVVDKVIADTKTDCKPVAYSYVAETDTGSSIYFETVCDNAKGYLVQVWKDPKDVKTFANKMWLCDATTMKARTIDCELTKLGVEGAKAAEAKRLALVDDYFNPKPKAAAPAAAPAAPAAPRTN